MTDWQSHPTFRGLVAAGATDAYALDLAAEWLEEALAELPDVLLWYAGGPPSWHHEDDAQRAEALWRWLRLVEPKREIKPFDKPHTRSVWTARVRHDYVRLQHERQYDDPGKGECYPPRRPHSDLAVKCDALQAFPDVEAEITFPGNCSIEPLEVFSIHGNSQLLTVQQRGGAPRQFHVNWGTAFFKGDNSLGIRLPAPQWIGQEDVARAAMVSDAVVRVWRDAEVEAVAGEELFAGDYVDQAPDGRIYRGEVGRQFGRALHNAPAGGAVRIIPPATTRPSGRQRFINLAGDVVEIDEVGHIDFITPPASPPAPPA